MFFCFEPFSEVHENYPEFVFPLITFSFYSYRKTFSLDKMEKSVGTLHLFSILSSGKMLNDTTNNSELQVVGEFSREEQWWGKCTKVPGEGGWIILFAMYEVQF